MDRDTEIWILNMRMTHWDPPDGAEQLDALWGNPRGRYFELVNDGRTERGERTLINDEIARPELAATRRELFIDAELEKSMSKGCDSSHREVLERIYLADGTIAE